MLPEQTSAGRILRWDWKLEANLNRKANGLALEGPSVGLYVPLLEFNLPVADAHAEKLNSCGLSVEMNFRASLRASYCAKRSAPGCPALCVRTPTVDAMSSCDAPEISATTSQQMKNEHHEGGNHRQCNKLAFRFDYDRSCRDASETDSFLSIHSKPREALIRCFL